MSTHSPHDTRPRPDVDIYTTEGAYPGRVSLPVLGLAPCLRAPYESPEDTASRYAREDRHSRIAAMLTRGVPA